MNGVGDKRKDDSAADDDGQSATGAAAAAAPATPGAAAMPRPPVKKTKRPNSIQKSVGRTSLYETVDWVKKDDDDNAVELVRSHTGLKE